jgi:hypothetical protein
MFQGSKRKVARYRMVNGLDLLSAQVGVPYLPLLSSQHSARGTAPERAIAAVAATMLSFSDAIIEPRVVTAPTSRHAKQASKQIARAMASSPELVAMMGLQLTHSVVRWRCEVADHISGDGDEIERLRSNPYWRELGAALEAELPLSESGIELLNLAARHYRFLDGDFALKDGRDTTVYVLAAEEGDQQGMIDAREHQEATAQRCLMWDSITDAARIVGPSDLPLLEWAHPTAIDASRYMMLLNNHALVYSNTAEAIVRAVGA